MGRVITLIYDLKDKNTSEILESNSKTVPISFITDKDQILPKLEQEVKDLKEGEEKYIHLTPAEGFGEYDKEGLQTIPKEQFVGVDLKIGMELLGEGENGETSRVIVKEIKDDSVVVDFNHPYAGKDLEFFIKVLENREASEDEMLTGVIAGQGGCGCHSHDSSGGCCGGHHHHEEEDECCGGEHHKHGGCCGKHHH